MSSVGIVIIVGVVVVLAAIFIYNSLVRLKIRVDEAWSDITVQLKRRLDLIPNLVETVKGYAKHEKTVFENVTKARANALNAQTVSEVEQADNQFQTALKSLFAVAEAYPALRASENYQSLQDELTDTEDKIQASRRFYNGGVRDLNIKIDQFPSNIFARLFGFAKREFFELDEAETKVAKDPVKVDFDSNSK
jgi:LemA protein